MHTSQVLFNYLQVQGKSAIKEEGGRNRSSCQEQPLEVRGEGPGQPQRGLGLLSPAYMVGDPHKIL